MWEITLIGKPCDIGYFIDLKDTLYRKFKNEILVVISFEKDLICSIATTNNVHIRKLKLLIYETIIKVVKAEIYHNSLEIFTNDKSLNSFILSSLIIINLNDEVNYAKAYTSLTKVINVRSFVYFKLHNMIDMWYREIDFYNYTFGGIHRDEFYLEFLRFVAQNLTGKFDIMFLEDSKDTMRILDKKHNMIKSISKNDEIGVIVNLIMLGPKKIIIKCIDKLSQKVATLINYIFEDKVSVIL